MPAPLRTIMAVLWVACLAGAFFIVFLTFGWVGWTPVVISGIGGLILGIPAGIWTARAIKREDPAWPPHSGA